MYMRKTIAAVEIGTNKVSVLLGEIDRSYGLDIIGCIQAPSRGVQKGEIVDFRAACEAVHEALNEMEKKTKVKIESVYLSLTGKHLKGFFSKGSVTVSARDGLVNQLDINRAIEEAKRKELPSECVYIHHLQRGIFLDGRKVDDPYTMQGEQLEVSYWNLYGNENKISDSLRIINGFGFDVGDMIVASIASGYAVTSESERRNGVLVIDIGAGTTDYVVYKDDRILKTGMLSVGGNHLTNDLSMGLYISNEDAEKLKQSYGERGVDDKDKSEKVWLLGDFSIGDRAIPSKTIDQILRARTAEIFSFIKEDLNEVLAQENLSAGVILTGGGSRLSCISEEASRLLNMRGRSIRGSSVVDTPEYSTVLGLIRYGMRRLVKKEGERRRSSILYKMAKIFHLN